MSAKILTTTALFMAMVLGTTVYANEGRTNSDLEKEAIKALEAAYAQPRAALPENESKAVEVYDLEGNLVFAVSAATNLDEQAHQLYRKYITNGDYLLEHSGVMIYLTGGNL